MPRNKKAKKGKGKQKSSPSTSSTSGVEAVTVDDLTAKVEAVSLIADNNNDITIAEKNKGPDQGTSEEEINYSQVVTLIQSSKSCGFKLLEKTADVVKTFLVQDGSQIDNLMKVKEFIPFLAKCVRAKAEFPSLQLNTAWIFEAILKTNNSSHLHKLKAKNIVPLLIHFLDSSDASVLEQVIKTIALIAENFELRDELLTSSISSNMFKSLARILKRKNPPSSQQLYENVSLITTNMITGGENSKRRAVCAALFGGRMELLVALAEPPSGMVKAALPVISLLMDSNDDEILQTQLSNICAALVALDSITPFISSRLTLKLASYLDRDEADHTIVGTAVALGTIASLGAWDLLMFLDSIKGTYSLKNYWKCAQLELPSLGGDGPDMKEVVLDFIEGVCRLIMGGEVYRGLNVASAIIESGFAEGLAKCLHITSCSEPFKEMAFSILGMLANNIRDSHKAVFIAMNLIPHAVKYLRDSDEDAVVGACKIIALTVDASPERRDEALACQVLPALLMVVEKYVSEIEVIDSSMKALECILKVTPRPPLATFQLFCSDPLKSVQKFFSKIGISTTDLTISAMECVLQFVEYGPEGIDLIFAVPFLTHKMISFTCSGDIVSWTLEPLLEKGAEFILRICQMGSAQQLRSLLDMGALEHFRHLLKAKLKTTRKSALSCLFIFLSGELKSEEKMDIDQLKPIVLTEVNKRIPETQEQAQAVYKKMIA